MLERFPAPALTRFRKVAAPAASQAGSSALGAPSRTVGAPPGDRGYANFSSVGPVCELNILGVILAGRGQVSSGADSCHPFRGRIVAVATGIGEALTLSSRNCHGVFILPISHLPGIPAAETSKLDASAEAPQGAPR
jgi:hypothetical protein